MTDPFFALFTILDDLRGHRADPDSVMAAAPPVGTLPPPQGTWPLLGLMHYGNRVGWAWKTMRKRLRPQLARHLDRPARGPVRSTGALSSSATEGIVPGLPDWEFRLDGNASYLRHRGTQEYLVVDILNGPDVLMEDGLILNYQSRRDPNPADLRLRELFPDGDGLRLVLDGAFLRQGIVHRSIEGAFELSRSILDYADVVEALRSRLTDPAERLGLFAAVGDWPAAHDAALALGRSDLAALTAVRADACRREWRGHLCAYVRKFGLSAEVLLALAHAGAVDLPEYVDRALAEPALADPALTIAALKVIADDPSWCGRVFKQLTRQPTTFVHVDHECALYLARHSHRVPEVIDHLRAEKAPPWDVLIRLALTSAPEVLPDFVRSGLRSWAAEHRLTAAAVLAILDTAGSRRALLCRLQEAKKSDATEECRAALRECRGPQGPEAADQWEAEHPDARDVAMTPCLHAFRGGCANALREEMAELAGAVRQARGHFADFEGE